ncbi:MAG: ABC transporter permease [Candidatus Acidiferrales bacterium]
MRPEHWWYTIPLRLRSLFRRRQADRELDDELRDHVEQKTAEYVAKGMTPQEARRQALLELRGIEQTKEKCRDTRRVNWLQDLLQDLRYALRMLRKSPAFTTIAVVTLALGIGANTAIFSLVDCLVVRPLPVDHPHQLAYLISSWNGNGSKGISYPDYQEIRKQTVSVFSDLSVIRMFRTDGLSVDGKSRPISVAYATGNFFGQMGIKPALGRFILPSEGGAAGADPVLVLSYSYWKSQFAGDPNIIGKKALANGQPVTIVGVAPAGFHGLISLVDVQGYMPLGMAVSLKDEPADFLVTRDNTSLVVMARLRAGVNLQEAQSALNVVAQRLSEQYHGRITLSARRLSPAGLIVDPRILTFVSFIFLLLATSVLVLACMNIANLFLVRAARRQREMAMRAALGATRSRLIRQLLTESLLLATLGSVAGMILGLNASSAFSSIPLHTTLPIILDFHFDWRVFAYALAAAVLTGVLVGIVPALRTAHGDVSEILHEGERALSAGGYRMRNMLVAAQVGGSLMLLIVAGLFARSLEKVQRADLGFDANHVLNLSVDPHEAGYDESQAREFYRALLDRTRALPGVQSASLAAAVPMGYNDSNAALEIDGYRPPKGQERPVAGCNSVSSQYFETMRIPLLRGRDFSESDGQNSQRVAIVNQAFADRYWHGEDPIGQHFRNFGDLGHPIEVVGVVKDSYEDDIFTKDQPFFFASLTQNFDFRATLQVRTAAAPEAMERELTGLVRSLEPAMPVFDVQTMTTALDTLQGFLIFRFTAALAASLGILGLLLAVVGVYGVISYAANQRTHEIGIRLALGAQPAQVLKMIFRQGFVIVGVGVLGGVLAAAAVAKLIGNLLFGVPPLDPLTYIAASLLLAGIAMLACYIPARRAMRVDPMVALRYE